MPLQRHGAAAAIALSLAAALAGCSADDTTEQVGTTHEAFNYCTAMVEGTDFVGTEVAGVDWAAYHGSGRGFAFMKITQNTWIVGNAGTFQTNWAGAKSNGVYRIAYHFFDATADPTAQAQAFVSAVQANGGLGPDDTLMVDAECPCDPNQSVAQGATAGCHDCLGYDLGGGNGSGWEPPSVVKQRLLDLMTTLRTMTGKPPIVYSYHYWLQNIPQITGADSAFGAFPLFIANTGTDCANLGGSVPAPWSRAYFWQYSWTGSVPGIPVTVDMDRFLGSTSDLQAFAAPPCGTAVDQPCTSASQCCSGLTCKNWSYSGKAPYSTFCCGDVGASCSVGTDCCGGSNCDSITHKCTCVPAGQWCINADECCAGYTCDLTANKCVTAPPDAGSPEAGPHDAGGDAHAAGDGGRGSPPPARDAGGDAPQADGAADVAGTPPDGSGGCSCRVARAHGERTAWLGVFLAIAVTLGRRRSR